MRSNCRTGIRIRDIIYSKPLLFVSNFCVWFIAHNLPLLIILFTKQYFSVAEQSDMILAAIIVFLLISLRILLIRIGAKIDIRCQQAWSKHLYYVVYNSIIEEHSRIDESAFVDGLNNDIPTIVSTISYGIDTVCNVLYAVFAIFILATIDIKLTLLILVFPALSFFISIVLKAKIIEITDKLKRSENKFSQLIVRILSESRIIRIEAKEKELIGDTSSVLAEQEQNGRNLSIFTSMLRSVTSTLSELSLILILGYTLFNPKIRLDGSLILFISYSFDISGASQYINSLIVIFHKSVSYMKDFNAKYCMENATVTEEISSTVISKFEKNLQKNSVHILIGANGSGKSKLLLSLHTYLSNSVLLQVPIHLLNLSIVENICSSIQKHDDVFQSIVDGVALSPDEFPNGYDTIINSKAANISNGQAFRIALARTLYSAKLTNNCDYVLIDDNLLSVDLEKRKHIFNYLSQLELTIVIADQEMRELYEGCKCVYCTELSN